MAIILGGSLDKSGDGTMFVLKRRPLGANLQQLSSNLFFLLILFISVILFLCSIKLIFCQVKERSYPLYKKQRLNPKAME